MTRFLLTHAPHAAFVAIGVAMFFWAAYRKPPQPAARNAGTDEGKWPTPKPAPRIRRSVARRGLLALGPLLGAVGTGAILYGVNVGGSAPAGTLIWVHAGLSLLALLLVGYKLADLGPRRLRHGLTLRRLPKLLSMVLGALSVPLLITGIDLLLAPSTGSFAAYTHLVTSAWWTGLLLWHLRRYLGRSLHALIRPGVTVAAPSLAE
jgi:hypothetical protein